MTWDPVAGMLTVRTVRFLHKIGKQICGSGGQLIATLTQAIKVMRNLLKTAARLVLLLGAASLASAQEYRQLKAEDAYRYAAADTGSTIEIDWFVEPGYYMYRGKMSYESSSDAIVLGDYALPAGEPHEDEFFGVQDIYRDSFYVSIPYTVVGELPASVDIVIKSQGCSEAFGFCHPPQTWTETVRLIARSDEPGKITLGETFGSFGGGASSDFLPVDEAFEPILTAIDGNTVEVAFRVADGYYLYKDKITARADSDVAQAGILDLPAGKLKTDQYFGEMEVYHGDVFGELAPFPGTAAVRIAQFPVGAGTAHGAAVAGVVQRHFAVAGKAGDDGAELHRHGELELAVVGRGGQRGAGQAADDGLEVLKAGPHAFAREGHAEALFDFHFRFPR